ncbi:hypothetical protein RB12696 [Rhodopirellula baltica SH 1]|uniref:Uncharacterized protein n=1 Tax=Rhodopirellula baltica (strain DSM 10527 / NCIMB 13988 / SH1) TaxID=243090 RepID=Q7UI81_RHOBA|nr:hypothetical protein RB12696 [Rhodopirellula baltica SH 1]
MIQRVQWVMVVRVMRSGGFLRGTLSIVLTSQSRHFVDTASPLTRLAVAVCCLWPLPHRHETSTDV